MKAKNKKLGVFQIVWYCILGFLILGYIIMPFLRTFLQVLETETGYGFILATGVCRCNLAGHQTGCLGMIIFIQILLIILPIAAIVYLSFMKTSSIMQDIFPCAFTLENYLTIFEKPRVLKPLLNSLKMSAMAVVAGLVITVLSSNEVAIQGLNKNMEEASKSLGANIVHTFLHVIIPNIAPGIMAGGVLILIKTIGEYTMSALLYGVYNRPISISMVTNMQEYKVGISLAYGVIVIIICYAALALIFKLDRKRFL